LGADVGASLLSVFIMAVGNGWSDIMHNAAESGNNFAIYLYFIGFNFVSSFLILNIIQSLFVFIFSTLMSRRDFENTMQSQIKNQLDTICQIGETIKRASRAPRLESLLLAFEDLDKAYAAWIRKHSGETALVFGTRRLEVSPTTSFLGITNKTPLAMDINALKLRLDAFVAQGIAQTIKQSRDRASFVGNAYELTSQVTAVDHTNAVANNVVPPEIEEQPSQPKRRERRKAPSGEDDSKAITADSADLEKAQRRRERRKRDANGGSASNDAQSSSKDKDSSQSDLKSSVRSKDRDKSEARKSRRKRRDDDPENPSL
jgi:hypothetical protein